MRKSKQFVYDMYEKTDEEILDECRKLVIAKIEASDSDVNRKKGKSIVGEFRKHFELIKLKLDRKEDSAFLDIGCNNGEITEAFARYLKVSSENSFGIDIEDQTDYCPGSNFKKYDGKIIPFEDESFNYVSIIQTLHHVQELDEIVREISRVVKPGGLLIIKDHDCDSDSIKCLMNIEHKLRGLYDDSDFPIVTYLPKEKLMAKFEESGFEVLSCTITSDIPTKVFISVLQKK